MSLLDELYDETTNSRKKRAENDAKELYDDIIKRLRENASKGEYVTYINDKRLDNAKFKEEFMGALKEMLSREGITLRRGTYKDDEDYYIDIQADAKNRRTIGGN